MSDERLEQALRAGPPGEPAYVPRIGSMLRNPDAPPIARPVRARSPRLRLGPGTSTWPAAIAAGVAVLLLSGGLLLRANVPGGPPDSSPSPSRTASLIARETALAEVIGDWGHPPDGVLRSTVLAVTDAGGSTVIATSQREGDPFIDQNAYLRVGEITRAWTAHAVTPGLDPTVLTPDTTVADVLPDFPNGRSITVGQLMDGTAGLTRLYSSNAELAAAVLAAPDEDWSPAAMYARARAAGTSFAPGSGFEPTDSAWYVLQAMLDARTAGGAAATVANVSIDARGVSAARYDTGSFMWCPDWRVSSYCSPRSKPMFGHWNAGLADGGAVPDLPDALLSALGIQGSGAAVAVDLANDAADLWGTTGRRLPVHRDLMLAGVDGPNRYGFGVMALSDDSAPVAVVGAIGHTGASSAVTAYDRDNQLAIGILVDRDVSDVELRALLGQLVGILTDT